MLTCIKENFSKDPAILKVFRIALYPGDGIGPEVLDAAMKVVEAAERVIGGFHLECERFDWGIAYYDRHGLVTPKDYLNKLKGFDAIFLGASAGLLGCPIPSRSRRLFNCARRLVFMRMSGRPKPTMACPVPCAPTIPST